MDKAVVEAKVEQLKSDREAFRNDYLRLDGAILVLESLLAEWPEGKTDA